MIAHHPFSFLLTVLFLAVTGTSLPDGIQTASPGPQISTDIQSLVNDHYLIEYNGSLTSSAITAFEQKLNRSVAKSGHYEGVLTSWKIGSFSGAHVHVSPQDFEQLKNDSAIRFIEPNSLVQLCQSVNKRCDNDGQVFIRSRDNMRVDASEQTTWGQARISHYVLSGARNEQGFYEYAYTAGNPTVFILDTGISTSHAQFEDGRAQFDANLVTGSDADTDDHGHGTHVSATVGGIQYGVAKCPPERLNLIALKVLDKSGVGTWDGVIGALQRAASTTVDKDLFTLAIILLPLSGPPSAVLESVLQVLISPSYQMTIISAAGNNGTSTSLFSPSNSNSSITVAAIDETDTRAWFSNYGEQVTLFAPGTNITSAWIGGTDNTKTLDGTSQAAAHVAGLAAHFMQIYGPHTHQEMRARLMSVATKGLARNPGDGSPNLIAFNGAQARRQDETEFMVVPSSG
ncbi:peptidase S8/S53 domain-containing protein [Cladorrhinum sp. PSN259]|nr:peptidase S8/S53 domain-containing protein [Cladorrhinum sp. PSN259]